MGTAASKAGWLIFVVLALIYVLMLMRNTVAMRRRLEELKRKGR